MSLFVKRWAQEQLGCSPSSAAACAGADPDELEQSFASGQALALLLQRLQVIDQDAYGELLQMGDGLRRWRQLRSYLRDGLGVELTEKAMHQIMNAKAGAAAALLLDVKCAMDSKNSSKILPQPPGARQEPLLSRSTTRRRRRDYNPDPMLSHVLKGVDVQNRSNLRMSLHLRKFAEHEFRTNEREMQRTFRMQKEAQQSRAASYSESREKRSHLRTAAEALDLTRTQNWCKSMKTMRQSVLRDLQFEQTLQRKQDLIAQLHRQRSAKDAEEGVTWFELSMKRSGLGMTSGNDNDEGDGRLAPSYEEYESFYRRITQQVDSECNPTANLSVQAEQATIVRGIRERAREQRVARLEKERRKRRVAVAQRAAEASSPAQMDGDSLGFLSARRDSAAEREKLERNRMAKEEKLTKVLAWAATVNAARQAEAEEWLQEFCEQTCMSAHDHDAGVEKLSPRQALRRQIAERVARKRERHTQLCREVVEDYIEFLLQALPVTTSTTAVTTNEGTATHQFAASYGTAKHEFMIKFAIAKIARLSNAPVVDVETLVLGSMLRAQFLGGRSGDNSGSSSSSSMLIAELLSRLCLLREQITRSDAKMAEFRLTEEHRGCLARSSVTIAVATCMDSVVFAAMKQLVRQLGDAAVDVVTMADVMHMCARIAQTADAVLEDFDLARETLHLEHTQGEETDQAAQGHIASCLEEFALLGNRLVCLEAICTTQGPSVAATEKVESAYSDVFMAAVVSCYCKLRQSFHSLTACAARPLLLVGFPWNNLQLELFHQFQSRAESSEIVCNEIAQSAKAAAKSARSDCNDESIALVSPAALDAIQRDIQIGADVLSAAGKIKLYKPKSKPKDKAKDKGKGKDKEKSKDKGQAEPDVTIADTARKSNNSLDCVVVFRGAGNNSNVSSADAPSQKKSSDTAQTPPVSMVVAGADVLMAARKDERPGAQDVLLEALVRRTNVAMEESEWEQSQPLGECHLHMVEFPSRASTKGAVMLQELLAVLLTFTTVFYQAQLEDEDEWLARDWRLVISNQRQALLERMEPADRVLHLHQAGTQVFDAAEIAAAIDGCQKASASTDAECELGTSLGQLCIVTSELQQMKETSWARLMTDLLGRAASKTLGDGPATVDTIHQAWLQALDCCVADTETQLSALMVRAKELIGDLVDQLLEWYRRSVSIVTTCSAAWAAAGYASNPFVDRPSLERRAIRSQTKQTVSQLQQALALLDIQLSSTAMELLLSFPHAVKRGEVLENVYAAAHETEELQLRVCLKVQKLCKLIETLREQATPIAPMLRSRGLAEIQRQTLEAYNCVSSAVRRPQPIHLDHACFVKLGDLRLFPKQIVRIANTLRVATEQSVSLQSQTLGGLADLIVNTTASSAESFPAQWCSRSAVQQLLNSIAVTCNASDDLPHCARRLILHLILGCVPSVPSVHYLLSLVEFLLSRKQQQGTPRRQVLSVAALQQALRGRMWWAVKGGVDATATTAAASCSGQWQVDADDELAIVEALALVSMETKSSSNNVSVETFIMSLCSGTELPTSMLLEPASVDEARSSNAGACFHSGLYKAWCVQAGIHLARSPGEGNTQVAESILTEVAPSSGGPIGPRLEQPFVLDLCRKLQIDLPTHELQGRIQGLPGPRYSFNDILGSPLGSLLQMKSSMFSVARSLGACSFGV